MQCFKSEVVNGLGTNQRGGETSSAGVIDEALDSRCSFHAVASRVTDGSESIQLTAPMSPEATLTGARRHSRRSNVCVFGLKRASADCSGQSEYGNTR